MKNEGDIHKQKTIEQRSRHLGMFLVGVFLIGGLWIGVQTSDSFYTFANQELKNGPSAAQLQALELKAKANLEDQSLQLQLAQAYIKLGKYNFAINHLDQNISGLEGNLLRIEANIKSMYLNNKSTSPQPEHLTAIRSEIDQTVEKLLSDSSGIISDKQVSKVKSLLEHSRATNHHRTIAALEVQLANYVLSIQSSPARAAEHWFRAAKAYTTSVDAAAAEEAYVSAIRADPDGVLQKVPEAFEKLLGLDSSNIGHTFVETVCSTYQENRILLEDLYSRSVKAVYPPLSLKLGQFIWTHFPHNRDFGLSLVEVELANENPGGAWKIISSLANNNWSEEQQRYFANVAAWTGNPTIAAHAWNKLWRQYRRQKDWKTALAYAQAAKSRKLELELLLQADHLTEKEVLQLAYSLSKASRHRKSLALLKKYVQIYSSNESIWAELRHRVYARHNYYALNAFWKLRDRYFSPSRQTIIHRASTLVQMGYLESSFKLLKAAKWRGGALEQLLAEVSYVVSCRKSKYSDEAGNVALHFYRRRWEQKNIADAESMKRLVQLEGKYGRLENALERASEAWHIHKWNKPYKAGLELALQHRKLVAAARLLALVEPTTNLTEQLTTPPEYAKFKVSYLHETSVIALKEGHLEQVKTHLRDAQDILDAHPVDVWVASAKYRQKRLTQAVLAQHITAYQHRVEEAIKTRSPDAFDQLHAVAQRVKTFDRRREFDALRNYQAYLELFYVLVFGDSPQFVNSALSYLELYPNNISSTTSRHIDLAVANGRPLTGLKLANATIETYFFENTPQDLWERRAWLRQKRPRQLEANSSFGQYGSVTRYGLGMEGIYSTENWILQAQGRAFRFSGSDNTQVEDSDVNLFEAKTSLTYDHTNGLVKLGLGFTTIDQSFSPYLALKLEQNIGKNLMIGAEGVWGDRATENIYLSNTAQRDGGSFYANLGRQFWFLNTVGHVYRYRNLSGASDVLGESYGGSSRLGFNIETTKSKLSIFAIGQGLSFTNTNVIPGIEQQPILPEDQLNAGVGSRLNLGALGHTNATGFIEVSGVWQFEQNSIGYQAIGGLDYDFNTYQLGLEAFVTGNPSLRDDNLSAGVRLNITTDFWAYDQPTLLRKGNRQIVASEIDTGSTNSQTQSNMRP